jgi:hypothetical protein
MERGRPLSFPIISRIFFDQPVSNGSKKCSGTFSSEAEARSHEDDASKKMRAER